MTREFKNKRGFFAFAQNNDDTDYLRLAYGLALSLKVSQSDVSNLSVGITPGMNVPEKYREVFDEVIDIYWLDEARNSSWKLENEWKAFHMTPYEETIKLDSDMLFPADISSWWEILSRQSVWPATKAETYRGELITSDVFRKTFTANDLPNVYSAMMYFKADDAAKELFDMAQIIYHNWQKFFYEFLDETRPTYVSTDVVFALAMKLTGLTQDMTFSEFSVPTFVHMKSKLQKWPEDMNDHWLDHVSMSLTPDMQLRIGRHTQTRPVHYNLKEALTDDMIRSYEKKLGI